MGASYDVFLSYAREDLEMAFRLTKALEADGLSVWWDREIPVGREFDDVIAEAIGSSKCVMVLWSRSSTRSKWVKEEANDGRDRNALIPVLIEDVVPPMGFRTAQAANLCGWTDDTQNVEFKRLLKGIRSMVGVKEAGEKQVVHPLETPMSPGPTGPDPRSSRPPQKTAAEQLSPSHVPPLAAPALSDARDLGHLVRPILERIQPGALTTFGIYIVPEIPPTKLETARRACGVSQDDQVLVLCDVTLFGSASDALLIGSRRIYYHKDKGLFPGGHGVIPLTEIGAERFFLGYDGCVNLGRNCKMVLAPEAIQLLQAIRVGLIAKGATQETAGPGA